MIQLPRLGVVARPGGSSGSPGLALDLGSARTRVWEPDLGLVVDTPTITPADFGYPVRRGRIIDTADAAMRPAITYKLAERLASPVQPAPAPQTVAVRGACAVMLAADRHPGVGQWTAE